MRTYSELLSYKTFKERYDYLRLIGEVGASTFGFDRYLNQTFYRSREWKTIRTHVIVRDEGYDLGIPERPIYGRPRIHHMNPVSAEDFAQDNLEKILDPEFLVCTSLDTHNAIHYGTEKTLLIPLAIRKKGDTALWTAS